MSRSREAQGWTEWRGILQEGRGARVKQRGWEANETLHRGSRPEGAGTLREKGGHNEVKDETGRVGKPLKEAMEKEYHTRT